MTWGRDRDVVHHRRRCDGSTRIDVSTAAPQRLGRRCAFGRTVNCELCASGCGVPVACAPRVCGWGMCVPRAPQAHCRSTRHIHRLWGCVGGGMGLWCRGTGVSLVVDRPAGLRRQTCTACSCVVPRARHAPGASPPPPPAPQCSGAPSQVCTGVPPQVGSTCRIGSMGSSSASCCSPRPH